MINSPMGCGDEIIVPGDLECSCNMVSSIWSVERKTYRYMCDIWGDSDSDSESDSESEELGWREENVAQNPAERLRERDNWCSLGEYFLIL